MVQKYKKVLEFANFSVPLQPLFGVIAGRKSRVACYVALERYNNLIFKEQWI
jgi:hypothetical protein